MLKTFHIFDKKKFKVMSYFRNSPIISNKHRHLWLSILLWFSVLNCQHMKKVYYRYKNPSDVTFTTKSICMQIDNTLKARHKSCFLRPDTGPCRADIIQWYFDARQKRCYRFFWGGCQGNGNRFESRELCSEYCKLNISAAVSKVPHYCSISFDYGSCFGQFYRWGWDKFAKTCKRYMYSGCGGNQNNFHTRTECLNNCLNPPNNTLHGARHLTTCIPLNFLG